MGVISEVAKGNDSIHEVANVRAPDPEGDYVRQMQVRR